MLHLKAALSSGRQLNFFFFSFFLIEATKCALSEGNKHWPAYFKQKQVLSKEVAVGLSRKVLGNT